LGNSTDRAVVVAGELTACGLGSTQLILSCAGRPAGGYFGCAGPVLAQRNSGILGEPVVVVGVTGKINHSSGFIGASGSSLRTVVFSEFV
jgi:hypothetical protein